MFVVILNGSVTFDMISVVTFLLRLVYKLLLAVKQSRARLRLSLYVRRLR